MKSFIIGVSVTAFAAVLIMISVALSSVEKKINTAAADRIQHYETTTTGSPVLRRLPFEGNVDLAVSPSPSTSTKNPRV